MVNTMHVQLQQLASHPQTCGDDSSGPGDGTRDPQIVLKLQSRPTAQQKLG